MSTHFGRTVSDEIVAETVFSDNTDPSQIEPSGSGITGEDDQLPFDDEDEIEEETEDEMMRIQRTLSHG